MIGSLESSRYVSYANDCRLNTLLWYHNARFQAVVQTISDRVEARSTTASRGSKKCASLAQRLATAPSAAGKAAIIRKELIEQLVRLLGEAAGSLDAEKPTSLYGFDSLVAAELLNWLASTLGVDMTLVQLLSKATRIEDVVRMAVEVNEKKCVDDPVHGSSASHNHLLTSLDINARFAAE